MVITSTLYSYFWDIKKDWCFLEKNSKVPFLRSQLAYKPVYYYIIIVLNLFLRLSWVLSISPHLVSTFSLDWNGNLIFFLAVLEIFRRFLWNFIRVEKEHVNNVGKFLVSPETYYPFEKLEND